MPINKKVKELKERGYDTITSFLKKHNKKTKPSEISSEFLNSLEFKTINNRRYFSKEDLEKILNFVNLSKQEKTEFTKSKRYNSKNFNNRKKAKQTCLERYGVDNVSKSKEVQLKKEETCLKNYGERFFLKTDFGKNNILKKYLEKLDEIQTKIKQTCLERYGVDSFNKSKEVQLKKEETCLKNHGVRYGVLLGKTGKYNYNSITFDSSWELIYYYWLKESNIDFEYHPDYYFEYLDDNGKQRKYFPDFRIKDKFIEIKGDQFFTKDGKLKHPYSNNQEEQLKLKNKFFCMIENNVVILRRKDLKEQFKFSKRLGNLKKYRSK